VRDVLEAAGRSPALFLDFDGTLTPIVSEPAAAFLSSVMRERIARLAKLCPVAIVSGRDREDVRERVGLEEIAYAGSHGYDIIGPFQRFEHRVAEDRRPALVELARRWRHELADIDGVLVEEKRYSVAVHYRNATPHAEAVVRERVQRSIEGTALAMVEGKKVLDVRPFADWHKGKAVRWLLGALEAKQRTPVYLGDNGTDELAFVELSDAVTVKVGEGPTKASLRLPDVDSVGQWLEALAAQLGTV
jgi:trehalose 6-phosphate phosphatase